MSVDEQQFMAPAKRRRVGAIEHEDAAFTPLNFFDYSCLYPTIQYNEYGQIVDDDVLPPLVMPVEFLFDATPANEVDIQLHAIHEGRARGHMVATDCYVRRTSPLAQPTQVLVRVRDEIQRCVACGMWSADRADRVLSILYDE